MLLFGEVSYRQTRFAERPERPLVHDANFYQDHLKKLVNAGVRGFKCFLIESGVDVSVPSHSTVVLFNFAIGISVRR